MKKIMESSFVLIFVLSLVLLFQNCSGEFKSNRSQYSATQSSKCHQSIESKLEDEQVLIGDMILPIYAVKSIHDVKKYWPEKEKFLANTPSKNIQIYSGVTSEYYSSILWEDGILPLSFDASISESTKFKVFEACNKLSEVALVECVEKTDQSFYVNVVGDRQGCSATVGKYRNSILNLSYAICMNEKVIIHELMHNFGVKHEQQHPDRDDYIRIIEDNIIEAARKNFVALKGSPLKTAFDFQSIMLYGSGTASLGGASYPSMVRRSPTCDAIERTNFPRECFFSQSNSLSNGDKEIMKLLYGSADGTNPSPVPPEEPPSGDEEPPVIIDEPPPESSGENSTDCFES